MIPKILTVVALLALATPALAQTSPYAGEAPRAIKALAEEDVANLLAGAGMGFARAAELNGVPGPRHALDMAADLHLSDPQRARLEEVFTRMQAAARRLGAEIVERERQLDHAFASGGLDADEVADRSIELGRLYGELRAVHLAAHLETTAALEPHQVRRYVELRGYGATHPDGAGHHGGHTEGAGP